MAREQAPATLQAQHPRRLTLSAAQLYSVVSTGDLCIVERSGGERYIRVAAAYLTPNTITIQDRHGRKFDLRHDEQVVLEAKRAA